MQPEYMPPRPHDAITVSGPNGERFITRADRQFSYDPLQGGRFTDHRQSTRLPKAEAIRATQDARTRLRDVIRQATALREELDSEATAPAYAFKLRQDESTSAAYARYLKERAPSSTRDGYSLPRPLINVETRNTITGSHLTPTTRLPGRPGVPYRLDRVQDHLLGFRVDENRYGYSRVARTSAATPVSDGTATSAATITYAPADAILRRIAHDHTVSREVLQDAPDLSPGEIDTLRGGVDDELESQLITGAGRTAGELEGIALTENHTAHAADTGVGVLGAFAIGKGGVVDARGRPGLGIVNAADWLAVEALIAIGELDVSAIVRYGPDGTLLLFGTPTVVTTAMPSGLVGVLDPRALQFVYKSESGVSTYREHANYAQLGLVLLVGEQEAAAVHRDPGLVHLVELQS